MPVYASIASALADGMLSYVNFDEVSGTAVNDLLADGNESLDSTVAGDVGDSSIITGKFNNARNFGAQSGAIQITKNGGQPLNRTSATVSFWLKLNSLPSTEETVLYWVPSNVTLGFATIIRLMTDGHVKAISGATLISDVSINDGAWHNIILTKTDVGNEIYLYIDNVLSASATGSSTQRFTPFYEWKCFSFGDADASLDDLGVWEKVIDSGIRSSIYNGGTGDILVGTDVTYSASLTVEINVEQITRSAKAFIEQQIYEEVLAQTGIEIQITDPVYNASVTLEQQIYEILSPDVTIEFQIFDHAAVTSMAWKPVVFIGGVDYSSRVREELNITYTENASAIANFQIAPEDGAIDTFGLVGQHVTIDYVEIAPDGSELKRVRRYTGKVDKPSYNPDQRRMTFVCTNDLQKRVATMSRSEIDSFLVGYWSPHIFNENASNWQYFQDQLSTLEESVWIDHSDILRKTSWWAASPDYEFTDANRVYNSIRTINPDKGDIINRININLDFRYNRLVQRNVFFDSAYNQTLCHFLEQNTFPLPTRSMVERAADSAGWVRMGAIAYDPLWEPTNRQATSTGEGKWQETGTVNCGGETKGWSGDPGGENPELCIGASFTLSKRWIKTLTETYSMTVEAPESIKANGVISVDEGYGIQAETDREDWETNYTPLETVRDIPGNTTTVGLPLVMPSGSTELDNGDWMFPADDAEGTGRVEMEKAQVTAMTKARVEILAGHRSRDITFSIPLDPFVALDHTVRLNTAKLQATGKVRTIKDTMDVRTGRVITEITLASSGSGTVGTIVDDPIAPIETIIDYPLTEYNRSVFLPWRLGGRLSSVPYDETWDGYTANYEFDPDDNSRPNPFSPFDYDRVTPDVNAYPRQFVVTTPDISEGDRTSETVTEVESINVNIPVDELTEIA